MPLVTISALVATKAVEIAAHRSQQTTTCDRPCWWSNFIDNTNFPGEPYQYYRISVSAGDRVRVAISWHAHPSADYASDPLDTNLNLLIFDPNWEMLVEQGGYSASWDNSYEIVEFEADQTGVYQVGVYKYSAEEPANWLGVAWTAVHRYDASYVEHQTPGLVLPDQDYRVCFQVRNDGYRTWSAGGGHPVHLGYHWYDPNGIEIPVSVDHRTSLPEDTFQGDSAIFCGWVRTPAELGAYTLQWDMVHEGLTWFADAGDVPPIYQVVSTTAVASPFFNSTSFPDLPVFA